jgi:arylsulfatase A-like enzyme
MRKIVVCLIVGAFLQVVPGCSRESREPNVILIVLDTLRADHLGCYGYELPTSPNIDRLATDSVVYERAVSAAPWTFPSHATLFTGLLPSHHHAHHEHLKLADEQTTVAERLADAGYETVGFCNNPWITEQLGMTQGFERFDEVWRDRISRGTFDINIFVEPEVHGMEDAGAATTLEDVGRWLDGRESSRPFFLFVNLIEPHTYFDPPREYRNRYLERSLTRDDVQRENVDYIDRAYADELDASQLERIRALYDGEIAYVDDWIGRFIGLLVQKDLLDASLLVVTSDHGEAFAEHRRCGLPLIDHQLSLYRELLDVPLIVRYPTRPGAPVENGGRVETPVSTVDVVPTILDVVGLDADDGLDGVSLAEGPPLDERLLIAEYYRPIVHLGLLHNHVQDAETLNCLASRRLVSVQSGDRKLIAGGRDGQPLFFDRAADPLELAPRPPGSAPEDRSLFETAEETMRAMSLGPELAPPTLDEAWRETMRSLGYVE